MALRVSVVVPPTVNLNTPYAALPRLVAWLRHLGHEVVPVDLSIEFMLRVFSRPGLERLFAAIDPNEVPDEHEEVYLNRDRYIRVIDDLIGFLQGRDPTIAHRIIRGDWLPTGPTLRAEPVSVRRTRFGPWGKVDHARHLATFALQDLAKLFIATVSPHFSLSNYAEKLAESTVSFDPLLAELQGPPGIFESMICELAAEHIPSDTDLVCMTCPFPGNLMGSLMIGKWLAEHRPRARRALGGGVPSTELRQLSDPRVFEFVDYVVLDDGEAPLTQITSQLMGDDVPLCRTFSRRDGTVVYADGKDVPALRFRELPAPDYGGIDMSRYIHMLGVYNPVHRFSLEGPWLKLTAAHGCYWKRCAFCDIHLPYIAEFDPLPAKQIVDQMDAMYAQTRIASFHFTDEAVPPPLLVNVALELLRRERSYQWWGNIRYDPGFTRDRCRLLSSAGMLAVTGGIEIASDELLPKMAKGISVAQVTRVLENFAESGILTHAYLIYGFPGETRQDTVNGLEILRQLMERRLLHSGFFHRFSTTAHSPIGRNPELYNVRILGPQFQGFGRNLLEHDDPTGPRSEKVYQGLQQAIQRFAQGEGFDRPIVDWFDEDMPSPTIPKGHIDSLREAGESPPEGRMVWLGGRPHWHRGLLNVTSERGEMLAIKAEQSLAERLWRCHPRNWDHAPRAADFDEATWVTPMRRHGLVFV